MYLQTERLILRDMIPEDHEALCRVLSDPENMRHYPRPYDSAGVTRWIEWTLAHYAAHGFGLWAVCLRDTGEMIGDCGLTLQQINGHTLPELGYHIRRDLQRRGYAREAAAAVRDWAFLNTPYPSLYSYCTSANIASYRTAGSVGFRLCETYDDPHGVPHRVSCLPIAAWPALTLRTAGPEDRAAILRLYDSVRNGPFCAWDEEYPGAEEVDDDLANRSLYLLGGAGELIGAASCCPIPDPGTGPVAELTRVCIAPHHQGKGLSRALVFRMESTLRSQGFASVRLMAVRTNTPAVRCYEGAGYRSLGCCRQYEKDFIIFEKEL